MTVATRAARRRTSTDLALIAGFAALIAASSVIALPIGPVPVTLQTFAVLLSGAALGASRGFFAVLLYLALGAIGLPVFAGGTAGLVPFAGPTVGYLVGMPLAAWLTGFVVERLPRTNAAVHTALIFVAAFVGNTVFVYGLGIIGLSLMLGMSLGDAFVVNIAFVPLDLAKIALTAIVAAAVHRAFPEMLPRRRAIGANAAEVTAAESTSTSATATATAVEDPTSPATPTAPASPASPASPGDSTA